MATSVASLSSAAASGSVAARRGTAVRPRAAIGRLPVSHLLPYTSPPHRPPLPRRLSLAPPWLRRFPSVLPPSFPRARSASTPDEEVPGRWPFCLFSTWQVRRGLLPFALHLPSPPPRVAPRAAPHPAAACAGESHSATLAFFSPPYPPKTPSPPSALVETELVFPLFGPDSASMPSRSLACSCSPLRHPFRGHRLALRVASELLREHPTLVQRSARRGEAQVVRAVVEKPKYQRPDASGRFGRYGGKYVPETLISALEELEIEYDKAKNDPEFQASFQPKGPRPSCPCTPACARQLTGILLQAALAAELKDFVGRETPLYHADRLSQHYAKSVADVSVVCCDTAPPPANAHPPPPPTPVSHRHIIPHATNCTNRAADMLCTIQHPSPRRAMLGRHSVHRGLPCYPQA